VRNGIARQNAFNGRFQGSPDRVLLRLWANLDAQYRACIGFGDGIDQYAQIDRFEGSERL
jgi:hypothetical protein